MKGQSLGKRVMDIKVVSLMGNVPSLSRILLRWMFRLVELAKYSPSSLFFR